MNRFQKISLKKRVFIVFFGILFLMLGSYVFTVTRFITRFTARQLNDDYNDMLLEISDSMQDLLWNLTLTSGQLLDNDSIQNTVQNYQEAASPYIRQGYYASLLNDITMLTMANTDVSLLYLYDNADGDFIFSSFPVNENSSGQLPVLYENSAFVFCGPCSSQSSYNGNPVLVLNRTETLPNGRSVTLSIESGFYSLSSLADIAAHRSAFLAVTSASGKLVYTNFSEGSGALSAVLKDGRTREYRSVSREMSQGWQVSLIVPDKIYLRDYYHSLRDVGICSFFIAILVGILGVYFWKSIYAPLQIFNHQLEQLLEDDFDASSMHSTIPEYEHLLGKVSQLQRQIQTMIRRFIAQQQVNTRIQTEKLRAQINPHFLLNTLNTMHWIALMNDQQEIDSITQALSHLLSYNLDKENVSTNLERELSALQEYVQLQKVRYDFQFHIVRPENEHTLNYPCPKFMLQPLVENALSHGYRPAMEIRILLAVSDSDICITIKDTGTGMNPDIVSSINQLSETVCSSDEYFNVSETEKDSGQILPRFGIGLSYVIRSLREFFPESSSFHVVSELQKGTTISIKMPKQKGAGYHAENIDH